MSMRLLLLAALAAAGACASAPRGQEDAPLAARLSVTASGMDVGLSDQAHVAVFAVSPGQGVALVYPEPHERSLYMAGWSTLAHNAGGQATSYHPRLARFTSPSASAILVLVASREPIDVRRYAAGASLERALGHEVYRSYDADAVIDGITRLAVPNVRGDDWAMDVTAVPITRTSTGYALLDEGRFPFESPYVTVFCQIPGAQGPVVVHVEFARYACTAADVPPSDSTTGTGDDEGGLSASRAPITRRAFAPAEGEAMGAGRGPAEASGRVRADGRSRDAARTDRRVRAPQEGAADARGAGSRSRQTAGAPDRSGGADRGSGGERTGGADRAPARGGGGGARHP